MNVMVVVQGEYLSECELSEDGSMLTWRGGAVIDIKPVNKTWAFDLISLHFL